jgi:hypothetical protein
MIYVFGKGHELNIAYDGNSLTEQDKKGGIPFKELPVRIDKEGYDTVLFLNDNNQLEWKYYEKQKLTLEELVIKQLLTIEQYKKLTGKDFTF